MDIAFTNYVDNDFNEFKEMAFGLYVEDHVGMPMTLEKIKRTIDASIRHPEKIQIVMIRSDDIIIGYGLITFLWSNEYGGDVLDIDEIYVKKEYRNKQVATRFMKNILETNKNVVLFELEATPTNKGAITLYESLGFEVSANLHLRRIATS